MARTGPAWERLVSEGWFQTREEATRWILSGRVRAGSTPVTSAGQRIPTDAPILVKGHALRYVAKGGLKLEGALNAFSIETKGRVCIDAGASTGGFTDCLVQRGAALVYAVDVGYGQLAGSLRNHPAVVNLERTNLGDDALLSLAPRPTLGTVDLSYLSLRKAVPQFAAVLHGEGELICLIKPLFEVEDSEARRTGSLSEGAYAPMLEALSDDMERMGHAVCAITNSPVTGNAGTLEFFLHLALSCDHGMRSPARQQAIAAAIEAALSLPAFHRP